MLSCQRDRFSIPEGEHYLNGAYFAPLLRTAEEAAVRRLGELRLPRIGPEAFFEESDRVRELFARLIGSDEPRRVAILPAVSYGIAVTARNVEAMPGGNLVLTGEQFPSNVYAWLRLAERERLRVRRVARPVASDAGGDAWTARILEAIDADTAVVALPHVHWTDGTRFGLPRIARRSREVGAALIVDGSQSVGALPFDVSEVRPDAVICAGYKWLLGPYSLCVGWFGPRFDDGEPLEETWIARRGSDDFRGLVEVEEEYLPGAIRYDVGERSNFLLLPMLIAGLEAVLEWRPERIQAYCRDLLADLIARARERGALPEPGRQPDRAEHILGLPLPPGSDPRRMGERLAHRRVHASLRGYALRISANAYNRPGDVDALAEALWGEG